jgi:glycosyltransferase involved in cell wall biosynthesis
VLPPLGHPRGGIGAMRIALCKSRFAGPVSGADETLVAYAIHLRKAGHDVHVVTLYPYSERDPYYRRLTAARIPVVAIVGSAWAFALLQLARRLATHALFVFILLYSIANHARGLWTSLLHAVSGLYYGRCRRFFEANRFDVVHLITPDAGTPILIRACHAAGLPTLYQELGSPDHPDATRHYRRLVRVLPLCTSVVALSPALARAWSGRFQHAHPIGVLPLLVSPPRIFAIPRRPMPYDVVFGFSGRLEALKGPLTLLRAFARLGPTPARCYVRFAGEGAEAYKARRLSFALGVDQNCDFVGQYNGLLGRSAYLDTLDVFVLPSRTEGTPNSIIEAMASGLPVIASDVGGITDLLEGGVGLLIKPGDVEGLAAAMRRLANDPELRVRMGTAARQRYTQIFSEAAILPVLLAQYALARTRYAGTAVSEQPLQAMESNKWTSGEPSPPRAASL